jgi:hypothetical protein
MISHFIPMYPVVRTEASLWERMQNITLGA